MSIATIIASAAVISSAVSIYYIWKLYGKVASLTKEVQGQFSEMDIDSKLSNMFSDTSTTRTVDGLTKLVFDKIKTKYGLSAKSYSSVIDEVKMHTSINIELKEVLVDFFNEVVRISYRAEEISESEKQDLKEKIKMILQIVG